MHVHLSQPPEAPKSLIHRLPAALKLFLAVGGVITIVALRPGWGGIGMVAIFLLILTLLGHISLLFLFKRLLLLEPIVLGVAMMSLFQPAGWRGALLIVARCTLSLVIMLLLANTTPASELIKVLRQVRMPALMVTTIALMYRYLFVLGDQLHQLRRARASRTFLRGHWLAWKSMGNILGQLFIRAADRADRVYAAMCARGWR